MHSSNTHSSIDLCSQGSYKAKGEGRVISFIWNRLYFWGKVKLLWGWIITLVPELLGKNSIFLEKLTFFLQSSNCTFVDLSVTSERPGPNCVCPSLARWMCKLWNAVIAPRVQEAILARASVKRHPSLVQTTAKKHPSQGQQAVVKAALSILLNKAVLRGCPLQRAGMWVSAGSRGKLHSYVKLV